jgi:steroid 5-alpha reductase family enzyme
MSAFLELWLTGLGAAFALVLVAWVVSLVRRDASVIDCFWGSGFALLSWVYFLGTEGPLLPRLLPATLVTIWGGRLSLHILWRSRDAPEDYRYREMRERHGSRFPLVSLFTVFLLQGALLWLISTPLLQAGRATELSLWHLAAVMVFAVGFLFETVGDLQLSRFRADLSNTGQVMKTGLWRYTRHPNYFGDALVWWSFFLLALAHPGSGWTFLSPLLMTALLLKVSGVSLLEQKLRRTRAGYAEYVARTNAFFPWFPTTVSSDESVSGRSSSVGAHSAAGR